MGRPDSIVGLVIELGRRRRGVRWSLVLLASLAAALGAVAVGRTGPARPAPRPSAEWTRWSAAPRTTEVMQADPAVVATATGWLLAWTHWERGAVPVVRVAALDRDGRLRGLTRTVSTTDAFARGPSLARDGARVAVVWTERSDDAADEWYPHPAIAVVDANAAVIVPARRVGDDREFTFDARVASDGQGWGVAWRSFAREHPGLCLARLAPDTSPRGPTGRHGGGDGTGEVGLAWIGDAWLAPSVTYDYEHDRSAVRLQHFDRAGQLIGSRALPATPGDAGHLSVAARASSAWVTWADDAASGLRHDPRFVAIEGRDPTAGPRSLGPRRSGNVPALACAATRCTSAWVGLPEGGQEPATLHLQVIDRAGAALGPVRRVGPRAVLSPLGDVAIAWSADERETLTVWTLRDGPVARLMAVRLDADGAPLAPPAVLPLP